MFKKLNGEIIMIAQTISLDLWDEFEKELSKVKTQTLINLKSGAIISKSLRKFWEKFLNEKFPEKKINKVLEKNFAIYICQNNLDITLIKQKYLEQNWKIDGLLGWIKKVQSGELHNLNINEMLIWSNENNKFAVDFLESAKSELEANQKFNILREDQLENHTSITQEWIIDKLIGSGKIILIAGKRATCKTWLVLNAIYSTAHGLKFLDTFNTSPCNILYIDRENGLDEMKKRQKLIKAGLNLNDNSNIFFLCESDFKLDKTPNLSFLEEFIICNNIKICVGDTYRRLVSFDEDKANSVSDFVIDMLKPLCERTKCSFILIAHEKKGLSQGDDMDMVRGSSDLTALVDCVIQLIRKGNSLIIKQTKNRGAKELDPFEIKIKTDESSYFSFEYFGVTKYKDDIISQMITDWILKNELKSFSFTEGLNYILSQGEKKNKFCEALSKLVAQGLLTKNGERTPYLVSENLVSGGSNE
mgnify:CR=1 FL=1